jgi:hypothetical protein
MSGKSGESSTSMYTLSTVFPEVAESCYSKKIRPQRSNASYKKLPSTTTTNRNIDIKLK